MASKPFSIAEKNQAALLSIARQAIAGHFDKKKAPDAGIDSPELKKRAAVFVTLTKNGQLRGCIGTTEPLYPLAEAAARMAVATAFQDYRFPPVAENEVKDIRIEISVLSPLTRVKNADEIKQNVHGVIARHRTRSGLFLPQVWEHFSTKEEFLYELCRQKAGLEPDAWRDPETKLYVFTVFAFAES